MKKFLQFTLVSAVVSVLYWWLFASRVELVRFQDGSLSISDFSYYAILVRGFWFEGHRGFYNLPDNIEVLKSITSPDFRWVMPLAVTPTAVFVFAPFAWIAQISLAWAQSVWVGCGLSTLLFSLRRLFRDEVLASPAHRPGVVLLLFLLFSSQVLFINLAQGQTSIFFLSAMIYLSASARGRFTWAQFFACFFAGVKPSYLLFVLFLLFGMRNWRMIFLALSQFAFSVVCFTVLCGTSWIAEYQHTFSLFQTFPLPETVASAFNFDGMNLFRTATKHLLPEQVAVEWSNRLLFPGVLLSGLFLLVNLRAQLRGRELSERESFRPLFLLMGFYFLFSPYIGTYEEILLIFLPFIAMRSERTSSRSLCSVGLAVCLILCLNFTLLPETWMRLLCWLAKSQVFLLSYLLLLSREKKQGGGESATA